jgi:hypothetical protein
MGGGERAD